MSRFFTRCVVAMATSVVPGDCAHLDARSIHFASSLIGPARFPESSGASDDVFGLRVIRQKLLENRVRRIVEIRSQMPGERRRFEELHASSSIRVTRIIRKSRIKSFMIFGAEPIGGIQRTAGQQPPTDPTPPEVQIARLKAGNERLAAESRTPTAEVRQLQLIVDAFRKTIGIPDPITSPGQVGPAVKAAAEAARRGAPKCASENVFARVRVRDGETTLTVTASAMAAQDVAERTGIPVLVGATLSDSADIERVLRAVSAYAEAKSCRFDYTLSYETKADYDDGRERFEKGRLFYAAGISADSRAPR